MRVGWSRRAFIGSLPSLLPAAEKPSQFPRFRDAATEFEIVRLTDPAHACYLPPSHLRAVSQRNSSLLYCSDSTGTLQVFRAELKSGEIRQVTESAEIDRETVSMLPGDRSICFFAGPRLMQVSGMLRRSRIVYEAESGSARTGGFGLSEDGLHAACVERTDASYHLRLITMARGQATTVAESPEPISDVLPRPRRDSILYRRPDGLYLVNFDGKQNRGLKLAPGALGPAVWSRDGRTVLYLSYPEDKRQLHQIREYVPDTGDDKAVAPTSQFVSFTRNGDSSVFAGVSASKASAHILLLLRTTRRELTLCEHRSPRPEGVRLVFSPDSQRLFYQTDRAGKPAIYSIEIERFVEETEA